MDESGDKIKATAYFDGCFLFYCITNSISSWSRTLFTLELINN